MKNSPYEEGREYWDASVSISAAAQARHSADAIVKPYEEDACTLSLMVYCLNDEATIVATLETVVEALEVVEKTFEIIVIDDGSSDRTVELVRRFMEEFPHISIVLRANVRKKGIACNYVDGAFIATGRYYRLVHGDNSEAVATMVDIFRSLGESDILVPYFLSMTKKSFGQRVSRRFFTWCVNVASGNRINFYSDLHVCLRVAILRWPPITQSGYFYAEAVTRLLALGFTCKQVPCRAVPVRKLSSHTGHGALAAAPVIFGMMTRRFDR